MYPFLIDEFGKEINFRIRLFVSRKDAPVSTKHDCPEARDKMLCMSKECGKFLATMQFLLGRTPLSSFVFPNLGS